MIATLTGKLVQASPLLALIDVNGVGYEVHIPVTTAEKLPSIGSEVRLHTLAVYREDSAALYGFASVEDKEFFRMLVEKVSGIGPKIALSIMSRLSSELLRSAIAGGDVALLSKCPGIGKKTAERLIIELRDKMGVPATAPASGIGTSGEVPTADHRVSDAVTALMTLGYKADVADKAVRKALSGLPEDADVSAIIRHALK